MPKQADRPWNVGYKGRRQRRNQTERFRRSYAPAAHTILGAIDRLYFAAMYIEDSFVQQRANFADNININARDKQLAKWDKACGQERIMWTVARKALEEIAEECRQEFTTLDREFILQVWNRACVAWDRPITLRENLLRVRDVKI